MIDSRERQFKDIATEKIHSILKSMGIILFKMDPKLEDAVVEIGKLYHKMEKEEEL